MIGKQFSRNETEGFEPELTSESNQAFMTKVFQFGRGAFAVLLLLTAPSAPAGMQETLEAILASEFRFARMESEVPFMPLGWLQSR